MSEAGRIPERNAAHANVAATGEPCSGPDFTGDPGRGYSQAGMDNGTSECSGTIETSNHISLHQGTYGIANLNDKRLALHH